MIFQAAWSYMKRGHDIKLPEWGGFWRWNKDNDSFDIHTRDGKVFDVRETNDVPYTIEFMFRTDWQLANPEDFNEKEKTEH